MARSPMAATIIGKTIGKRIDEGQIPAYVEIFGRTAEKIFVTAPKLKSKLGEKFNKFPKGTMGLYS